MERLKHIYWRSRVVKHLKGGKDGLEAMLADKMVELNYVESISHETVRQTLKKMKLSRSKKSAG